MRKHVLVVEADESVREILMRSLWRAGYTFTTVSDGKEAWEFLYEGGKCDVIISDHEMPGMTGVELLCYVRSYKRTNKIPFALLSGRATVSEENHTSLVAVCLMLSATFCPKPCNYALIAQLLG